MRGLGMKRAMKIISILAFLVLLGACAGADTPYNLLPAPGAPGGGVTPPPTTPPGGGNLGGCVAIIQNPVLRMKIKLAPGTNDNADASGLLEPDEKHISNIKLRFNGNQVSMIGDEFEDADVQLGSYNVKLQQVRGTRATGDYNAEQGSIVLNGAQFQIQSPLPEPLRLDPLTLTTGATGETQGNYGNLPSLDGDPIDSSTKAITLSGGTKIPTSFPSAVAEFRNAALQVSIAGTLDSIPNPASCQGGSGGGSVLAKEVVNDAEGHPTLVNLGANNTLSLGRLFAPQQGTDNPMPNDGKFSVTKVLRLKNIGNDPISQNIAVPAGFTIQPNSINLQPNAEQDLRISYVAAPVANYSEANVPASRSVTGSFQVKDSAINLALEVKRAASEMKVVGTDEGATSSITLGIAPAVVLGRGNAVRMNCSNRSRQVSISKNVSIENNGIRPLEITGIPHPVDSAEQHADPGCVNYGREFHRFTLSTDGAATCERGTLEGSTGFTGRCTIPPGNGKVKFKVMYYPMNASSVRNAQGDNLENDRATLSIMNNDPRFAGSSRKFDINLLAAVSPDRSDLIRASIEGSSRDMQAGKNLRINIPNDNDASIEKTITIKNNSEDPLTNVHITLGDPDHFSIVNAASLPTTIPGGTQGTQFVPGQITFRVRYVKDANPEERSHSAPLTVSYGAGSADNQSRVVFNLVGTVNHQVPTGRWNLEVDNISAYLNSQDLRTSPLESEDFRGNRNERIKSGDLQLLFEPWDDQHPNLRKVSIIPILDLHADDPDLLTKVRNLTPAQRAQMFKLYSTRMTRGVGVPETRVDGNVVCNEPASINNPHPGGNVTDLCAYFYYVLENGKNEDGSTLYGVYDDETGDLILPNLNITMVVPFHNNVARYTTDMLSVMPFKATVSTLVFDAAKARNFAGVSDFDLVFPPINTGSSFILPDRLDGSPLLSLEQFSCPGGASWRPTDEEKPKFGCYVTQNSPHYMRGISATPIEGGQYSIVVSMINAYGPENSTRFGQPQNIPFFMANTTMWTGIQGRLVPLRE